jgi:ribosomal-protein-serine acetyltransferase
MFTYRIGNDLELRLPEEHHAEEAHALVTENFAHLKEWLPWVKDESSLEDTRNYIRWNLRQFGENKGFAMNIVFQNRIAGSVGYNSINWENRKTEIGYWLGASFQGNGLISKACRALINRAFDELKLNRIEISCAVENQKSRAIPERLGFTQEGILRQAEWVHNHFNDLVVYAMLASDWQSANNL